MIRATTTLTFTVETKKKTGLKDESVLIEKNQYCMFENTQDEEGEVFNVEYLDLESSRNLNVLHAYNAVLKKQENYDAIKNDYINSKKLHLNEEKQFKNEWLDRLVKSCMNLDNQDELLQLNNIIQEKTKPEPPWWQFLKKDDCDMCVVT